MVRFVLWYGLGAKSHKNRTKPYPVSIDTGTWYDLWCGGIWCFIKYCLRVWFGCFLGGLAQYLSRPVVEPQLAPKPEQWIFVCV